MCGIRFSRMLYIADLNLCCTWVWLDSGDDSVWVSSSIGVFSCIKVWHYLYTYKSNSVGPDGMRVTHTVSREFSYVRCLTLDRKPAETYCLTWSNDALNNGLKSCLFHATWSITSSFAIAIYVLSAVVILLLLLSLLLILIMLWSFATQVAYNWKRTLYINIVNPC